MRTPGLVALVLLASAAVLAQGQGAVQSQTPSPQFRAGVELIQLDVTVLDDQRRPVRGLTAADFTVLDDGVATPIRAFTPVELAGPTRATEAVWAADVPSDVVTNDVGARDGRLVIILMDRTIPVHQPVVAARKIAAAAVAALGPDDLAAVVSTRDGSAQDAVVQNLTADRSRLLRAINAGDPSTGMSLEAEAIWAKNGGKLDPRLDGRCICGLCVLETVTRVADAVQHVPRRRKLLLFIGTSVIWQATSTTRNPVAPCETPLKDARAALFAAIDRANLTVHAIDPQGLVNVGPQTRGDALNGEDKEGKSAAVRRLEQQQEEMTTLLAGQTSLRVLPDRTGGRTIVGRNNADQAVPEIFRESEAYYVLGIERGMSGRADGTRPIEVKVARKGVRAYAQRLYAAPTAPSTAAAITAPSGAPASTDDALTRVLPSAGVPLGLGVTVFANPESASAKPVVRINVDAGAFARGDRPAVPLDVAVMAVDRTGRPVASARQTSTVPTTGPARSVVAGGSPARGPDAPAVPEVNVQSHLDLEPGDYGIRVAVSDAATGRVASVFADVTVPAFTSAPMSLSGVSVEIPGATGPVVTTRRVFRQQDQVRAVLQIYQGTERTDPIAPVSMRVQILDAKGAAVRDQTLPFAASAFTDRRADCVITLPLSALPAGAYLLKLDASVGERTSGRALRFVVE